jgi:hypothetical protein
MSSRHNGSSFAFSPASSRSSDFSRRLRCGLACRPDAVAIQMPAIFALAIT